jgi:predicted ATPase
VLHKFCNECGAPVTQVSRSAEYKQTFCESHATDVPFRVVVRLLRTAVQISGLDDLSARARVRALIPDADPEDMLVLDDLLGIADPNVELPRSIRMRGGGG